MASFALRCWTEISRAQLVSNYRAICATVGAGVEVAPVVKADAYHHGAVEVARVLAAEGVRWFAVATAEEGAALREAGLQQRILVMSDALPRDHEALAHYRLTPVIHSLTSLQAWDALARTRQAPLPYHLKIDTGFGRLGAMSTDAEVVGAVLAASHVRLEGIMTHFASATDYESRQTEEQLGCFQRLLAVLAGAGIRPSLVHLASSAPVAYGMREAWGNMVRPGIALYGYVPAARGAAPPNVLRVKPVLQWKASVLTVKDLPAGFPVGYGALFRAPKPMRIAVISAGYADGVPHTLSNKGQVIAGGRLVRILGAVSMDVTTIDVTDCPPLRPGDPVTLIGQEGGVSQDADELARAAGVISYAILCGISSRVRRIYC